MNEKHQEEIEIPKLFRMSIVIDEYEGFKNVEMVILRWDNSELTFNPVDHLPDSISFKDEITKQDAIKHLKEYFTNDEIFQINKYLKRYKGATVIGCYPCTLPKDGSVIPLGRLPGSSRDTDFYLFFEEKDYNLPFKIAGFFDLRCHERIDEEVVSG